MEVMFPWIFGIHLQDHTLSTKTSLNTNHCENSNVGSLFLHFIDACQISRYS